MMAAQNSRRRRSKSTLLSLLESVLQTIMSITKSLTHSWTLISIFILLIAPFSHAKVASGNFKLTGVNTEHTLTKFAVSPYGIGEVSATLSCSDMYENEQSLKLHLYLDTQWSKAQKATTCTDMVRLAQRTLPISFDYDRSSSGGKVLWKANVNTKLYNDKETRTHYYYVVVDDCSLEWQNRDMRIPKLHYEVTVMNDIGGNNYVDNNGANAEMQEPEKVTKLTHLSADEVGISTVHSITMLGSILIALLMALTIFSQITETKTVHAALFLVFAAAGCDASASFCEILHRKWYERNGYGWYFFDALSSHLEAMTDSLVAIVLLSIASGWTLPSDVVPVPSSHTSGLQSLIQGLRNPAGAIVTFGPAGILAVAIILLHAILAQWGRTYDDDFDAYHDLEHMPGRLLMMFRMLLGLLLVAATVQTKRSCPPSLQKFYVRFAIVGTVWFQSLPVVTWTCSRVVPYYLRHPTIVMWGAIVQSSSLVLLSWLVTSHAKDGFHKMSRLMQAKDDLTDELGGGVVGSTIGKAAAPKSWKFGKAKIRLD